jgi:hypothetical protein
MEEHNLRQLIARLRQHDREAGTPGTQRSADRRMGWRGALDAIEAALPAGPSPEDVIAPEAPHVNSSFAECWKSGWRAGFRAALPAGPSQEERHVNVHGESFTDADLKAAGQDWCGDLLSVTRVRELLREYDVHDTDTLKHILEDHRGE